MPDQRHDAKIASKGRGVGAWIGSATSEGAEFALHLGDVTTIPLTDPPLILWSAGARRKNRCREIQKPLPLRIRA